MHQKGENNVISCNSIPSDGDIIMGSDSDPMGKEERKRQVLGLLVESGLALPPSVIFYNAKRRGATFERRSVDNYLDELQQEGRVTKEDEKRGYYVATEKGRDYYLNF